MPEPSVNKHRRNKEAEESLAKHYRDIGIKAVAAAVTLGNKIEAEARGGKPVSTKPNENHSKRRRATNE